MSNNRDSWSQSKGKPANATSSRTPHEVSTGASFLKKKVEEPATPPDMYFLDVTEHEMDADLSKVKGYQYRYLLKKAARENPKIQEMTVMNHTHTFMADNMMIKIPIIKYPQATRRLTGRMWPGEDRRRLRKTLERKTTRSEAAMLCKFMLFKKGKFIPGKMV